MYYVIFTGTGQEERAEELIKKLVPGDLFTRCFHPVRHMKKKIRGQWVEKYERLIPGYVFVESEDIRAFYHAVRELPAFLRLLGKEQILSNENGGEVLEEHFYPLPSPEEKWLRKIAVLNTGASMRKETPRPIVPLTKVWFNEEGEIEILEGPLKDIPVAIKKKDIHNRYIEVETPLFGRTVKVRFGVELVEGEQQK